MRRYGPWLYAVVVVVLLASPTISMAAGVTMDPLATGGYTARFTNPRSGWRALTAPMDLLAKVLGTDPGDPCDGQLVMFHASPGDRDTVNAVRWSIFSDAVRGHNLTDGRLMMRPIDGGVCGPVTQQVAVKGGEVQAYTITVEPLNAIRIRPGTYMGQAVIDGIDGAIPITLQVRDGIGVALLFAMLGLLANWLLNRFRAEEGAMPLLIRYRQLTRRLLNTKAPLLLQKLSQWISENLHSTTADALTKAQLEIDIAQMLMSPTVVTNWVPDLDQLRADDDYAWGKIRTAIEALPSATLTITKLFEAVKTAAADLQVTLTEPPISDQSGVEPEQWKQELQKSGNPFLADWVFAGSMTLGMQVVRTGIFVAAIAATGIATVVAYKKIPDFGADILIDYGIAFGVGYGGKVFNDFMQKVAPSVASSVSVNPNTIAGRPPTPTTTTTTTTPTTTTPTNPNS